MALTTTIDEFPVVIFMMDSAVSSINDHLRICPYKMNTLITSIESLSNIVYDTSDFDFDNIIQLLDLNDVDSNMQKEFCVIQDFMQSIYDKIFDNVLQQNYKDKVSIVFTHFRNILLFLNETITELYPSFSVMNNTFYHIANKIITIQMDLLQDSIISDGLKNNENIIKVDSFKKHKYRQIIFKSKTNCLKIASVVIDKPKYLINVIQNECTCPDFLHRKMKKGLSCKHLLQLKNKNKCLTLIQELQREHLYNVNIPMKHMLKTAYSDDINY